MCLSITRSTDKGSALLCKEGWDRPMVTRLLSCETLGPLRIHAPRVIMLASMFFLLLNSREITGFTAGDHSATHTRHRPTKAEAGPGTTSLENFVRGRN